MEGAARSEPPRSAQITIRQETLKEKNKHGHTSQQKDFSLASSEFGKGGWEKHEQNEYMQDIFLTVLHACVSQACPGDSLRTILVENV